MDVGLATGDLLPAPAAWPARVADLGSGDGFAAILAGMAGMAGTAVPAQAPATPAEPGAPGIAAIAASPGQSSLPLPVTGLPMPDHDRAAAPAPKPTLDPEANMQTPEAALAAPSDGPPTPTDAQEPVMAAADGESASEPTTAPATAPELKLEPEPAEAPRPPREPAPTVRRPIVSPDAPGERVAHAAPEGDLPTASLKPRARAMVQSEPPATPASRPEAAVSTAHVAAVPRAALPAESQPARRGGPLSEQPYVVPITSGQSAGAEATEQSPAATDPGPAQPTAGRTAPEPAPTSLEVAVSPPGVGAMTVRVREDARHEVSAEIRVTQTAAEGIVRQAETPVRTTLSLEGLQMGQMSVSYQGGDAGSGQRHNPQLPPSQPAPRLPMAPIRTTHPRPQGGPASLSAVDLYA